MNLISIFHALKWCRLESGGILTHLELAKAVFKISYLSGEFVLRSGKISQTYFDKYRFESQPHLLKSIAEKMVPFIPGDTEVLAGLELGGVPIAIALGLQTGIPVALVRKTAKDYGTKQFCEGLEVKNKRVLVIEDVVTTGGQVVKSTQDLRGLGAIVDTVLCVIDRSEGKYELLTQASLKLVSLLTMQELLNLAPLDAGQA
jgi:orotate phosphoribosyltransferase